MVMRDDSNLRIYRRWAPFYDALMGPLYARGRRRAVDALALQPGDRLFVPGIGTGLDLPTVPEGVDVTGIDLSSDMLAKARRRALDRPDIILAEMNAQSVDLPDASFDAVLCNLVLSVVPDGGAAFREAWRVLKPGGRLAIFDKFVPEGRPVGAGRRLFGRIAEAVGTDVNRRLDEVVGDVPDLEVLSDQPDMLGGQYRVILLRKRADATGG